MEQYFINYASLDQQRWMVSDKPRTDAFARAIAEVVKPGDFVIDVGAGTGVLSLLAAKAGANRVIGVEQSEIANFAKELILHNNFDSKIEIIQSNAFKLQLDEPADLIVSEWLGHMAYVENMFRSVIHVRDAWLKPQGTMIPYSVDVMLAPIDDVEFYNEHGPGYWEKSNIYDIDFSCFTQKELQMGHSSKMLIPDKFLLAKGKSIHHLNCIDAKPNDEWCLGSVEYEIERDGMINGFAGWFSSLLSPNVILDTAPNCPRTHWEQTYFPFYPMEVKAGQIIKLDYRMDEPYEDSRLMELALRIGKKEINYIID
ncbi:MAG: 50S ribosomal protein L11 methyltransferase [Pseudomonadota bacterium]